MYLFVFILNIEETSFTEILVSFTKVL
jgi:hypothetical protein